MSFSQSKTMTKDICKNFKFIYRNKMISNIIEFVEDLINMAMWKIRLTSILAE
jgi:hypothetical protein